MSELKKSKALEGLNSVQNKSLLKLSKSKLNNRDQVEHKICESLIRNKSKENAELLYSALESEWNMKKRKLERCGELIDKLKLELLKHSYMPTKHPMPSKKDLTLARSVLEIAVEYSVIRQDIPAFSRYMSQLKQYYYDYKNYMDESLKMYKLLGLNLIYLLSENKISELHTEVELIPHNIMLNNKYIAPVFAINQYFIEGRFNKVFAARKTMADESYNFFMDKLLITVRDEIGSCLEKAYEKMSIQDVANRLNLKTVEQVKLYGQKRKWTLSSHGIYYFTPKSAKPKELTPFYKVAEQTLSYARDLESII